MAPRRSSPLVVGTTQQEAFCLYRGSTTTINNPPRLSLLWSTPTCSTPTQAFSVSSPRTLNDASLDQPLPTVARAQTAATNTMAMGLSSISISKPRSLHTHTSGVWTLGSRQLNTPHNTSGYKRKQKTQPSSGVTQSLGSLSLSVHLCQRRPPFLGFQNTRSLETSPTNDQHTCSCGYIGQVLPSVSLCCTGTHSKAHISAVKYHGNPRHRPQPKRNTNNLAPHPKTMGGVVKRPEQRIRQTSHATKTTQRHTMRKKRWQSKTGNKKCE